MAKMKRLFIAIDLPLELKEKIYEYELELKKIIERGVKWVELENIHITLRFLGETDEEKIIDIEKIMDSMSANFYPFLISIGGLGAFPNLKNPRVIWIGIGKGENELRELSDKLETKIRKLGFRKEEREFSPHLTIGRVKEKINLKDEIMNFNIPDIMFLSEELTLFESKLTPSGPIYTTVYKSKFKKN
jgi:2'-5' RNA ligase